MLKEARWIYLERQVGGQFCEIVCFQGVPVVQVLPNQHGCFKWNCRNPFLGRLDSKSNGKENEPSALTSQNGGHQRGEHEEDLVEEHVAGVAKHLGRLVADPEVEHAHQQTDNDVY